MYTLRRFSLRAMYATTNFTLHTITDEKFYANLTELRALISMQLQFGHSSYRH